MVEGVEQGLGGMFANAVAGVDDRLVRGLGGDGRRADLGMAEHDHVGVAFERTDGVGQALALGNRGVFDLVDGDDGAPSRSMAAVNDEEVRVDGS